MTSREAAMQARWDAERRAELAAMPERELVRKAREIALLVGGSGYAGNHYSQGGRNRYAAELARRREAGETEAAAE